MTLWKELELFTAGTLRCGEGIHDAKDSGILLGRLHFPELADLYIFNTHDIIFYFILSYLIDFSPDQSQIYNFLLIFQRTESEQGEDK